MDLRACAATLALVLAGCSTPAETATQQHPQAAFWDALSSHCGNAYAGELVSEDARDADWQGREMVAHWAECSGGKIAIAFHIEDPEREDGWDRSRTWLVGRMGTTTTTTTSEGTVTTNRSYLRLKHDHRHEDGSEVAVTQYGGDTEDGGTLAAQDFPVDRHSIDMFTREGLDASLTNVWRLEVTPAESDDPHFVYQLTRRNDPTRLFRVRFDANEQVEPPPPAWGR